MAVTLEDLKRQNDDLQAELARLEQLERLTEEDAAFETKQQKLVSKVKEAFDSYDKDKSGYIDSAELAALANQLGETLDAKELEEAMKAIDLSGDKRISFGEFMRWWTRPDKHASAKSALKLAALKTKLHSQFAVEIGRNLVRQLSGLKLSEADAKDFVTHRVHLGLGDFVPGATARLELGFEPLSAEKAVNGPVFFESVWELLPTASPSNIAEIKGQLENKIGQTGLPVFVEVTPDNKTARIYGNPPVPDPLAITEALNLDLKKFVEEVSFKIDLASPLDAFIVDDGRPLADLIGLQVELKTRIHKALFRTAALSAPIPGIMEAFWATFLETFNISLSFGNLSELLAATQPNSPEAAASQAEALEAAAVAGPGNPATVVIQNMHRARGALTEGGFKATIAALIASKFVVPNAKVKARVDTVRTTLKELKSIVVHTQSGVKLSLTLNNFLPIHALPSPRIAGAGDMVVMD